VGGQGCRARGQSGESQGKCFDKKKFTSNLWRESQGKIKTEQNQPRGDAARKPPEKAHACARLEKMGLLFLARSEKMDVRGGKRGSADGEKSVKATKGQLENQKKKKKRLGLVERGKS